MIYRIEAQYKLLLKRQLFQSTITISDDMVWNDVRNLAKEVWNEANTYYINTPETSLWESDIDDWTAIRLDKPCYFEANDGEDITQLVFETLTQWHKIWYRFIKIVDFEMQTFPADTDVEYSNPGRSYIVTAETMDEVIKFIRSNHD